MKASVASRWPGYIAKPRVGAAGHDQTSRAGADSEVGPLAAILQQRYVDSCGITLRCRRQSEIFKYFGEVSIAEDILVNYSISAKTFAPGGCILMSGHETKIQKVRTALRQTGRGVVPSTCTAGRQNYPGPSRTAAQHKGWRSLHGSTGSSLI